MQPLRVLVAEDNAIIGGLLAEMLAEMGHEVCGLETTAVEAVAAAMRHRPDLMIVDAQLGDASGVVVMREVLRKLQITYLFISGGLVVVDRRGDVVLQKPFREQDLARAIERAVAAVNISLTADD